MKSLSRLLIVLLAGVLGGGCFLDWSSDKKTHRDSQTGADAGAEDDGDEMTVEDAGVTPTMDEPCVLGKSKLPCKLGK